MLQTVKLYCVFLYTIYFLHDTQNKQRMQYAFIMDCGIDQHSYLMQDCGNVSTSEMELLQSWTKPSDYNKQSHWFSWVFNSETCDLLSPTFFLLY